MKLSRFLNANYKEQYYDEYLDEIKKSILKYNKLLIPFMLIVFIYFVLGDFLVWHVPVLSITRYPGILTCLLLLFITYSRLRKNRKLVIVANNIHSIALLFMGFSLTIIGPDYDFKGIISCILFIVASHFFVKGYRAIILVYSIGFAMAIVTLIYSYIYFPVYSQAEIMGLITVFTGIIILSFYNEKVRYNEFFFRINLLEEKNKTNELYIETQSKNDQLEKINKQLDNALSELDQIDKSKNKLFSIIAHDLRSPITTVVGLLEELNKNFQNYKLEEIEYRIKLLAESSDNTLTLINNLLYWSSTQWNGIKIEKSRYKLIDLVQDSVSAYINGATLKNLDVEINISNDLHVLVDEKTIRVVIANLFNNAIKFTKKGGKITLSSEEAGTAVKLLIRDNGIGMKPESLQKLFKLGQDVKRYGTENEKGTGLGLMLAAEFVAYNGGEINVESEENKGSCFTITLPVA